MNTMACVWCFVIVIITINEVFGNQCSTVPSTCDQCIRCGGQWCNAPQNSQTQSCAYKPASDWCAKDLERRPEIKQINTPGLIVSPQYAERTIHIDELDRLDIHYTANNVYKPTIITVNSTQSSNLVIREQRTKCSGLNCTTTIEAHAKQDFCTARGRIDEFVYVQILVGSMKEQVVVKYHVPCACECSRKVEKNAPTCNSHGDLTCGVCTCHDYWVGKFCEKLQCPEKRGDVQCMDSSRMNEDCFGNGYCNGCDECICYTDREGSQYFDKDNYCIDICRLANDYEDCLVNTTMGYCDVRIHSVMKISKYNETISKERDDYNRSVWVSCNLTTDDCSVDYVAMVNEDDEINVMIVKSCNDAEAAAIGGGGSTVSIVLIALAVLAVVSAVAGVMVWKHMNAVPPVPLKDPKYENIDAEDCIGENPLYKPPTSSFKNPTYGKW